MTIKKVIIPLLSIAAFLVLFNMMLSEPNRAPVMAESVTPQATPQATATRKPTKTPTATIDHAATLDEALAKLNKANATSQIYQLTANAAIALQVQATADQDKRDHERQMAMIQVENKRADIENTAIVLTSTAEAPASTRQVIIHGIEIGILTMEAGKATQTVEAPALIKKSIDAQYYREAKKAENFLLYAMGTSVLVIVLLLCAKTAYKAIQDYAPTEPTEPPDDDLPQGAYIEGIDMRIMESIVSRRGLQRIAYGYFVRNKSLTHFNWTPAKLRGFSENQFANIQKTLVHFELARWGDYTHKSGIILTDKGVAFLWRFLGAKYKPATTPPLIAQALEPIPHREEKTDRQAEGGSLGGEEVSNVE